MSDWLETNRERIDELASSLGLEFLGAVELQKESLEFERFKSWIDRNWHAEMHFLEIIYSLERTQGFSRRELVQP